MGTDEDDNVLFQCAYCGNIIPVEMDGSNNIVLFLVDDTCPECGATITQIDLD